MKKFITFILVFSLLFTSSSVIAVGESTSSTYYKTEYSAMLARAEAVVNYEWVPTQDIEVWNENPYNGKMYFPAGETVKGMPYTLFSWELGIDSLLSLEEYKPKNAANYSTEKYCNSVSANRVGPAYGTCCATFVSEVFGGNFVKGISPVHDSVQKVMNADCSLTYRNVKASALQPGDAISNTVYSHIMWVGDIQGDLITIYEATPPVCRKITVSLSENTDSSGYFVFNGKTYNIVSKNRAMVRDDLETDEYSITKSFQPSFFGYTISESKTIVFDNVNGNAKANKIYSTDLCFVDAVFDNGWCHVNFPLDAGGMDHGYVRTSVFMDEAEASVALAEFGINLYKRSDLSEVFGKTFPGYDIYYLKTVDGAVQVIVETMNGGYDIGWINENELAQGLEKPFLSALCPLEGRPCVDEDFEVKKADYVTKNGEIYTTDDCTINAVFNDGWCQVTFPLDSGGERVAYTPISNFIYDTDYNIKTLELNERINVYPDRYLDTYINWWAGAGDLIYILGEAGDAYQIVYPLDAQYGGGYKLGWIPDTAIDIDEEPIVDSVRIFTLPDKTEYFVGEEFDPSGFCLAKCYKDGSEVIISEGIYFSGFISDKAGTVTVIAEYDGFTVEFSVTVAEKEQEAPSGKYLITAASARAGEYIELIVSIADNPGIISLRGEIIYDEAALELINAGDIGILNGFSTPSPDTSSPYILRWADSVAAENNYINGEIVKLVFRIKDDATEGNHIIAFNHIEARDFDGNKIEFTDALTTVSVLNRIMGDVDSDGEVTDWDSILLGRYLADWNVEIDEKAADIDNDGYISDWDSVLLDRYLADWEIEIE